MVPKVFIPLMLMRWPWTQQSPWRTSLGSPAQSLQMEWQKSWRWIVFMAKTSSNPRWLQKSWTSVCGLCEQQPYRRNCRTWWCDTHSWERPGAPCGHGDRPHCKSGQRDVWQCPQRLHPHRGHEHQLCKRGTLCLTQPRLPRVCFPPWSWPKPRTCGCLLHHPESFWGRVMESFLQTVFLLYHPFTANGRLQFKQGKYGNLVYNLWVCLAFFFWRCW